MLGVKDAFSRRGRAVLIVLSLALALLTTVVVITADSSINSGATTDVTAAAGATLATPPDELPALPPGPVASAGVLTLFRVLQVLLSLVALANLLAAALMSARERTRELSVLEATGFSSRHLVAAATTSHGLLVVPAALIGLPLGFAVVAGITADIEGTVYPGAGEVALVVLVRRGGRGAPRRAPGARPDGALTGRVARHRMSRRRPPGQPALTPGSWTSVHAVTCMGIPRSTSVLHRRGQTRLI